MPGLVKKTREVIMVVVIRSSKITAAEETTRFLLLHLLPWEPTFVICMESVFKDSAGSPSTLDEYLILKFIN